MYLVITNAQYFTFRSQHIFNIYARINWEIKNQFNNAYLMNK